MTDLKELFGIDDYDGEYRVTVNSAEQFQEAAEEITHGLIAAGCIRNDVDFLWFPNAPTQKMHVRIKGVVKYEIILKES